MKTVLKLGRLKMESFVIINNLKGIIKIFVCRKIIPNSL